MHTASPQQYKLPLPAHSRFATTFLHSIHSTSSFIWSRSQMAQYLAHPLTWQALQHVKRQVVQTKGSPYSLSGRVHSGQSSESVVIFILIYIVLMAYKDTKPIKF